MKAFMRWRWIWMFIRYTAGATGFSVTGNTRLGYSFEVFKDEQ